MTKSPLKLKTYFSTTVEAAVELARRELGSEAMLVNSRRSPDEIRHLGTYEVIFATGEPPEPRRISTSPVRKAASTTDMQLEDIRQQLAGLRQSLQTRSDFASEVFAGSEPFQQILQANGVDYSLIRELLDATARMENKAVGQEELRQALLTEMELRIGTGAAADRDGSKRAVLAFVGPPGRGKSTTLVKLAIQEGLARRRPVRILSMDDRRIGAGDQMRSYSTILGVPFHACSSIGELDHQLSSTWGSETRDCGLTLIDTPGYGPNDVKEGAELAARLSGNPEINVHLVLRADTKSADGLLTVQRYSSFGVSRLVFTGMDEVVSCGAVFNIAAQSNIPISFLGSGQSIPEDLAPFVCNEFVRLVMDGCHPTMLAVA